MTPILQNGTKVETRRIWDKRRAKGSGEQAHVTHVTRCYTCDTGVMQGEV